MKVKTIVVSCVVILLIVVGSLVGPFMSKVESPQYKIVNKNQNIEIREYPSMLVAGLTIAGERKVAINDGFRVLADYIFGNNVTKQSIQMTKPVIQSNSEKIDMTAPVLQQGNHNQWNIRFVMPAQYNEQTIPVPVDERVKLERLPARLFVVIQFSGSSSQDNLNKHLMTLNEYISKNALEVIGEPIFAFYNPPWTLPFLRRNEIWYQIEK